jgi:cytochrome P450
MVDQDPLPRWTHGRVTLLGDAAHPMVPRGSNGAGQAILDARALADCLAAIPDPAAALKAYEDERLEATARIVLTNRVKPPDAILGEVFRRTGDKPFRTIDEVISRDELAAMFIVLLFAGHETSVNGIAHSVLNLLRHPDQLEKLRERPELIVGGVEEFVRFESSVQFWHTRSTLEEIEIAGTTIPAGVPLYLLYGSANRDPQQFENPDKLDLERPNLEHVGFSQGIHYCFGAPLARLEMQIAVSEFARRVENPRLVEDPPPYRNSQIFRGPRHVWLDIDGIRD